MDLTEHQKDVLDEFRKRVVKKVPPYMTSDYELLKWVVARKFNIDKAEDMLLKSLEWRKQWKVDTILDYKPPEVFVKYYTQGHSGYDKEGSPVLIIPFGNIDIRGMFNSCRLDDFITFTLLVLEKSLLDMRNRSVGLEVPIQKDIFIFDLENFSLRDFTWRPALETVLKLVQMYEANYPEILKAAIVVNAPYLFTIAFTIIKPFLDERTMSRIQIFGRSGWKDALIKLVPADQLPVHWGGTMTDPDGNPKCVTKICIGGKIPEIYYLKNKETDAYVTTTPDNMEKMIISKKEEKIMEHSIDVSGTSIKWVIRAVDSEVEFGIFRALPSGDQEIISMRRVDSREEPEEGSFLCADPGTYKMIFNNKSESQSKEIYFSIEITPPDQHTKF